MNEWIVPLFGFLGSVLVTSIGLWANRRKTHAEAHQIETTGNTAIVNTAITLVEPLRQEINTLRQEGLERDAKHKAEREQLKDEIITTRDELAKERQARAAAADKCAEDIAKVRKEAEQAGLAYEAEIRVLKRALNDVNKRLESQGEDIKKVKAGTGELMTHTPLPHTIPVDPIPPLPTRSTFDDRPSDQPPDDAG